MIINKIVILAGRREKYMPPKREEVDLFGESRLVQQGEIFEQVNKSLEETIIVLNSYGENLRIRYLPAYIFITIFKT
jgi:hypothetical protein